MADGVSEAAADGIVAVRGAVTEVDVADVDTGVDDVAVGVSAGRGGVDVRSGAGGAVRDRAETPRSVGLGFEEFPDLVRLDELDLLPSQ